MLIELNATRYEQKAEFFKIRFKDIKKIIMVIFLD